MSDLVQITMDNDEVIKLELYPEIAPITVENFKKLVNDGFYNGLKFHRIIKGFVIRADVLSVTEQVTPDIP